MDKMLTSVNHISQLVVRPLKDSQSTVHDTITQSLNYLCQ